MARKFAVSLATIYLLKNVRSTFSEIEQNQLTKQSYSRTICLHLNLTLTGHFFYISMHDSFVLYWKCKGLQFMEMKRKCTETWYQHMHGNFCIRQCMESLLTKNSLNNSTGKCTEFRTRQCMVSYKLKIHWIFAPAHALKCIIKCMETMLYSKCKALKSRYTILLTRKANLLMTYTCMHMKGIYRPIAVFFLFWFLLMH